MTKVSSTDKTAKGLRAESLYPNLFIGHKERMITNASLRAKSVGLADKYYQLIFLWILTNSSYVLGDSPVHCRLSMM